jgi:hypothetical protein
MHSVVRCPACRGESAVDPSALGLTVQCPRCADTFVAVPEAPLVEPFRSDRNFTRPPPDEPRSRRDEPRSRRYDTRPRRSEARSRRDEPEIRSSRTKRDSDRDHDHDPHRHPPGRLSPNVLIGLALLPFAIPILWLMAPAVIGQRPLISIAVPISIAVSTSILSLAVIYTIDWSPAVRIKGVLMILSLAYFASISFYFVNKEIVEQMKGHMNTWVHFSPQPHDYIVSLPGRPNLDGTVKPLRDIDLECYSLFHPDDDGNLTFVVGSGNPAKDQKMAPGTPEWFTRTIADAVEKAKGQLVPDQDRTLQPDAGVGREFVISFGDGANRIVRLYVIKGRVYYLSVEGYDLDADKGSAARFFESFQHSDRHKR